MSTSFAPWPPDPLPADARAYDAAVDSVGEPVSATRYTVRYETSGRVVSNFPHYLLREVRRG